MTEASVTKTKRAPSAAAQAEMVRQLSRSLQTLNWAHGDERIDFDTAGSFLGVKLTEDIEWMCKLGLLKPLGDIEEHEIECTEVLRFLKRHGAAWMQGRLEAMTSRLESELTSPTPKYVKENRQWKEGLDNLKTPHERAAYALEGLRGEKAVQS